MAQQLSVLIVIDVKATLAAGSLDGNYYLFDNNSFAGSGGQGTPNLVTALLSSQVLNWAVLPLAMLDPDQPIPIITGIGGEAVEQGVMIPTEYDSPDLYSEGRYFSGTIVPGRAGTFPYTIEIGWRPTVQSRKRNAALSSGMTIPASIRILSNQELSTPLGKALTAISGARP